jgi:hypothetical protein
MSADIVFNESNPMKSEKKSEMTGNNSDNNNNSNNNNNNSNNKKSEMITNNFSSNYYNNSKIGQDTELYEKEDEENEITIESILRNQSKGYTNENIKGQFDSVNKAIKDINLNIRNTVQEQEFGHQLYETVHNMIKLVGENFRLVIEQNFDLVHARQRCVEFRQRITEKRNSLKLQTLEKLLEPKEGLYKDDAMTKIEIETERLEKERQTQVQGKGSEQLSEIEQINSLFNENIENLITKINREFEKKYYADLRLYYDKTKKLNTAAVDLYDLDVQLSQEVVFEMLIGNFQSFSLQIVTKVNEFVKSNPTVANVLKEMVIIQATNEEIFNPLANSNLPGVFQILHDRYHKRSFVNFTTSLIHATSWTLSDEDTKLNPSKGVAQIEEIINTWESTNLWDQMTPDLFFTCLLLKGLSSLQPIKREAINEAVKFIRMYNEDEERSIRNFGTTRSLNGSHVSKPIFKHISDFIRREEENRKMGHDFIAAGTTQQSSKTQQQVPKNAVNSTTNSNSVSNQWSNKNNSFVKTNTEAYH